jgi:MinD-like ATPase involved in chromosome partitioning or flagellar assembly
MQREPKVFAFYSYKGGTGRTTASANVSVLLATKGHRVLCLDLDLEGPGIAIVFNLPQEGSSPFPLQDYFGGRREIIKDDFFKYQVADSKNTQGLWILPASSKLAGSIDPSRGGRLLGQLKKLIDLAQRELSIDAVIIDTPSGFGDLSALSMYVSHCVVALFRYSKQHVFGTAKVADYIKKNDLKFLPVASCVPPKDVGGEKGKYETMLATFHAGPVVEIKEDNSLKWRERVLVGSSLSPALKGYERLACELESLF